MSDKQVNLALVGCGGISGQHVKGYKDLYERVHPGVFSQTPQ